MKHNANQNKKAEGALASRGPIENMGPLWLALQNFDAHGFPNKNIKWQRLDWQGL